MRTVNVLLIVFLICDTAISQKAEEKSTPLDKGTIQVGGGIMISSTATEDQDDAANRISIMPQGYYFVINHLAVGGHIQLSRYSRGDYSSFTFGIGPAAKYYFKAGKFFPFVGGGLSYNRTSWESSDDAQSDINMSVFGGMDFFLAENVAVEPYTSLTFNSYSYGDNDSIFSTKFEIGVVFSAFIF